MKSITQMRVEQDAWRITRHHRNAKKIAIYGDGGTIAEMWAEHREVAEMICKLPEMLRLLETQQHNFAKMEMRYLGAVALLGDAMAYVNDDGLRESALFALQDAAEMIGGRVRKLGKRLEIQFNHPAQATTTPTT